MKRFIIFLIFLPLIWVACDKDKQIYSPALIDGNYRIPEAIENDWETAHVSTVGMDQAIIEDMIELPKTDQHSILIVKAGKLVYEEYFEGPNIPWNVPWDEPITVPHEIIQYTLNTIHYQASATKSVVSALIGICMDRGLIENVDQKIKEFFPQYDALFDEEKSEIALKDVLTMRAGIRWENGDTYHMDHNENQWVRYVLSRPMAHAPGEVFRYNDGLSVLLAEIVRSVSGVRADRFAEQHLFGPLGITNYYWMRSNSGEIAGGWGLYIRPRDMAKFGALFLQRGKWNGQILISESWVRESTRTRVNGVFGTLRYGYQWWRMEFNASGRFFESFFAWGAGSQQIFVIEDLDLVIVFTGRSDDAFELNQTMIEEYIIPACL